MNQTNTDIELTKEDLEWLQMLHQQTEPIYQGLKRMVDEAMAEERKKNDRRSAMIKMRNIRRKKHGYKER